MSIVAENLTYTLRRLLFEKILSMHVGWHDLPANNPGTLTNLLFADT